MAESKIMIGEVLLQEHWSKQASDGMLSAIDHASYEICTILL
jgi:hypothetical protein